MHSGSNEPVAEAAPSKPQRSFRSRLEASERVIVLEALLRDKEALLRQVAPGEIQLARELAATREEPRRTRQDLAETWLALIKAQGGQPSK